MIEHNNDQSRALESEPTKQEVAKEAYGIFQKEGSSQGNGEQNWLEDMPEVRDWKWKPTHE